MNDKKVKECIAFFVCRAGIYPFKYNQPLVVFFEKLMKQNKLKLDIPSCGNELIKYLDTIIHNMDEQLYCIDIFQLPRRDYDSKILSKDEVIVLEKILSDIIKDSRKIYESSQDSCEHENTDKPITIN